MMASLLLPLPSSVNVLPVDGVRARQQQRQIEYTFPVNCATLVCCIQLTTIAVPKCKKSDIYTIDNLEQLGNDKALIPEQKKGVSSSSTS